MTVHDIFCNFPVRQKVKTAPSIMKRSIEIVALGFPKIAFKFKDNHQFIQTFSGTCVDTFKSLFGQNLLESHSLVRDKESNISISGFVSNIPFFSKHHQYLYVNQRYICKSVIHDLIDARNKKGNKGLFTVFVLYITIPWDLVSLIKNDCYSYEMKLVLHDEFTRLISRSLGISIESDNISQKINQKKRKNNSSSIRSSKNIDYDSMFERNNSPFQLSVFLN